MAPKRRCPICRSKKWHKEPSSGIVRCSEGHILQDYRNETNETAELSQHARRKRTLKTTRAKKEKKSKANPMLYHGERARYHYFQSLQLLLRMQIKKLTELWKLPPEFEIVCRDTWALHLSLMHSPPLAEPYLHEQEQGGSRQPEVGEEEKEPEAKQAGEKNNEEKGSSISSESSSSSPSDTEEEDPEMAELLRQASETESSEDEGGNERHPTQETGTSRKSKKRWRRDDSPAATIAVLIHSCWLMRMPVIYKDFVNLIETYTLPYLDPVRLLPLSFIRHFTKHTKQALSPRYAPTPVFLHTMTSRLAKSTFQRYGLFTPELNAAPILWRAVCHMGGNPSLYRISKTLARYLEFPLTLNPAMASKNLSKDSIMHKSDNVPSEVALVATVVIALKLVYGLDGKEIRPREDWDPACTMPALDAYLEQLQMMDTSDSLMSRTTDSPTSMFALRDDDLDAYLDFCERALLDRNGDRTGNDLVAEYFPLQSCKQQDDEQDDSIGQAILPAAALAGGESDTVRPGASYAIYSAQDILGSLPDKYAMVLGRAARWPGVSGDDLSAVVERFERRLVRLSRIKWK